MADTVVLIPLDVGGPVPHAGAVAAVTCSILNLVLAPLDLNLLGLQVHLNQVVLIVNAIAAPGNLLGNLLCAVTNLQNGVDLGGLGGTRGAVLTTLLNTLVATLAGI